MEQQQKTLEKKTRKEKFENFYNRYYKHFLILPIILFLFSIFYLATFYQANGDIFYKDVSLTGGTTITVFDSNVDVDKIESNLKLEFPDIIVGKIFDVNSREQHGFSIKTKADLDIIKPVVEKYLGYKLTNDNSSIEFSQASLSEGFYKQLRFAMILTFGLMAIVVFIIFRTPIRSLSIILAGFGDIIMTITVINLLGVQLSTSGIVALLMLIGYSVDVDILLTARVFKNSEGSINQKIFGAFKTGITMTLAAMIAIAFALIFTYSLSPILSQMFTIILIGLAFDVINCWVLNASILKWYVEAKEKNEN